MDVLEMQSGCKANVDTIIDVLLEIIESIKKQDVKMEAWQTAGKKFRSQYTKTHAKMEKISHPDQSTLCKEKIIDSSQPMS